jgi:hypothetical protein
VGQDPVRTEREQSEGVDYDSYMLGRRAIWVWNWYGKWRPLKGKGENAAEENDIQRRPGVARSKRIQRWLKFRPQPPNQ